MSILETILSHETVVPMEKLTDITVEEDVASLEVDTSGNAWGAYRFVIIDFRVANPVDDAFWLHCNNMRDHSCYGTLSSTGTTLGFGTGNWKTGLLALLFTCSGGANVHGFYNSDTLYHVEYNGKTSEIQSLNIISKTHPSELYVKAGSRLQIWGVL